MASSADGTASGAKPPLLLSPPTFTCTSTATGRPRWRARRSSSVARSRRSSEWTRSNSSSASRTRPPIELGRQVETIERVDEVEQLERLAHLVRLQVADEVPRDRPPQRGDLFLRLLHAVLAEGGHAGGHGLLDALDLDRLGDADQEDVVTAAARALRRPGDPLAYAREICADVRHGRDSSTRSSASRERGEGHEAATVALATAI